jgi:hypothetical protein
MAALDQPFQRGHGERGRAEEGQAHSGGSVPLAGALHLADLALEKIALERADVANVEPAVQVIGLVQEGARQQVLAGRFKRLALGILRADGDALGAAHLLAETGNAEAALLAHLLAFDFDDGGVDEDELVLRALAVRDIDDGDLRGKPICGAARPTPLAAYIDSNISARN